MREIVSQNIIFPMANGLEDLKEKNKNRRIEGDSRLRRWEKKYGDEDSEMLMEKASYHSQKKKKSRWKEES